MLFLQASAHDVPGGYRVALVQALLALVAVCILAWSVLRWFSGRGLGALGGGQRIQVIERAHLDARRTLYLVRIGDRAFSRRGRRGGRATSLLAENSRERATPPGEAWGALRRRAEALAPDRGKDR